MLENPEDQGAELHQEVAHLQRQDLVELEIHLQSLLFKDMMVKVDQCLKETKAAELEQRDHMVRLVLVAVLLELVIVLMEHQENMHVVVVLDQDQLQ
jgi:hypothetical protein